MIKNRLINQKKEIEYMLKRKYVKRKNALFNKNNDLIEVVIGPRRAGKSFILAHEMNSYIEKFAYVNFDDEFLTNVDDYDDIIYTLQEVYGEYKYVFLDEIQNLEKWELFVNRLQRQGIKVFITGSNSNLLSGELATHLTGRYKQHILFPFSFKEFRNAKKREDSMLTSQEEVELLRQYIELGGYPEVIMKDVYYEEYLKTLLYSTLYKDIVARYNIRNAKKIEEIMLYLSSTIGGEFSYNKIKNILGGTHVSVIEQYVQCLEYSFLLFTVKRFSFKTKEAILSNKKVYCIDNGFINVSGVGFSSNYGMKYENVVAIHLKKRALETQGEIYFWKNTKQEEVDFVVKQGRNIECLIQVCYNVSGEKTYKREVRSLIHASDECTCDQLIILTRDVEETKNVEWYGKEYVINFIPLWKYLLEN